jgi:hypothetical protein
MSGKEKTIEEFGGWEDASQQHDFFGETNLNTESDVLLTGDTEEPETKKETPEKPEEETKEQKDAAFKKEEAALEKQFESFTKEDSSEEDEDEEDSPKAEKPTKVGTKQTLEFLKEKGLVDFELNEGEELTEELANDILEDSWEASVESAVEDTIKELPQEIKDLIKYASKGGNVGNLLAQMANHATKGLSKDSDITQESTQVLAITTDLEDQGYDQEYIDSQIEFLKSNGKLSIIAKKAFDKNIEKQEAERGNEVKRAAEVAERRKVQAREYKSGITSHIGSLSEVNGLAISKEDKSILPTYISDPSVEMQDGRVVSQFQADLFKVMADKDKITLLAKLVKTDFNFSSIARKEATKQAREIKAAIENTDKLDKKSSAGVHKQSKKAIWDMID